MPKTLQDWELKKRKKEIMDRFRKSLGGRICDTYGNMCNRIKGKNWHSAALYTGLSLLPREEFFAWSEACQDLPRIHQAWLASGCKRRLVPSIDRIDTAQGYIVGNMRWVPLHENSQRGGTRSAQLRKERAKPRQYKDRESYLLGYKARYTAGRTAACRT